MALLIGSGEGRAFIFIDLSRCAKVNGILSVFV